jgi:mannobiose 2-epimerase
MEKSLLASMLSEIEHHLNEELLPFWLDRCLDRENGGFITHFDKNGNDTGDNEKSLISQTRTIYTMSSAYRSCYGKPQMLEYAQQGVDFLIKKMWDRDAGGFFWMADRRGNSIRKDKVLYGHNFAVYALSEYTLASGDPVGLEYAEKCFDLIEKYCVDSAYGGYFEMFNDSWELAGPGSAGGDRKTLDAHMHFMEAMTTLYECSGKEIHRRKLVEVIDLLINRMLDKEYGTGVPQFAVDWKIAPQIKFDIIWGWDRFTENGVKDHPEDNTSFGHNAELAWLLNHARIILESESSLYINTIQKLLKHSLENGIDYDFGGVFVEGPHKGGVYDREKEFWQQAEVLIGMLDGYILFKDPEFLQAFSTVLRFVMDKNINHETGEWWPLLTREGEPIWTHMGHSWKANYHTVRSMIQTAARLKKILDEK